MAFSWQYIPDPVRPEPCEESDKIGAAGSVATPRLEDEPPKYRAVGALVISLSDESKAKIMPDTKKNHH